MEEQQIIANPLLTGRQKVEQLNEIKVSHKEELKQFDMSLVLQLDQKVGLNCVVCYRKVWMLVDCYR